MRSRSLAARLAAPLSLGLLCTSLALTACGGGDDDDEPMLSSGSTCPDGSTLTYDNFGKEFADTYCVGCHSSELTTPVERTGAPLGYDFDTVAGIRVVLEEVDEVAASGPTQTNTAMPPTGITPTPSEAERADLGEWLACGAP